MKTLLILLIGEMATPFSVELQRALPAAFPDEAPEVQLGENAPPGRSVAWVTLTNGSDDVELLLHTARIPGDLRRLLHFGPKDTLTQRANAVAFAVANLVRQREADVAALVGPNNNTTTVDAGVPSASEGPKDWALAISPFAAVNTATPSWGGGLSLEFGRFLTPWFELALRGDTTFLAAPSAQLWAPSVTLDALLSPSGATVSPLCVIGVGGAGYILHHGNESVSALVGVARIGAGLNVSLSSMSSLRALAAAGLSTASVSVRVGDEDVGSLSPVTVRLEIGYQTRF